MEIGVELRHRLEQLKLNTGYDIVQHNGQRKFGPPPDWNGVYPPKGCEVFVGKLPREVYEDELVPIFSLAGKIFELRLMMDFSGSNRGYAFVTYMTRAEASKAVKELNDYEIRSGRKIGVVKSVDNCKLYVGGIPRMKTKEEVLEELTKKVAGIVDVKLYKNCYNNRYNRGFAFVEFTCHRAAAMARRVLVPGCIKLWNQDVMVDWAEPEPDVDDEQMEKVKVLYVRNINMKTNTQALKVIFENAINAKIQHIKKTYDYAFVHFWQRVQAEAALLSLQNAEIDGNNIQICWSRPVNTEIYKIQKCRKGNAKFNNSRSLAKTLLLYKQHVEKREYENSPEEEPVPAPAENSPYESKYEAIPQCVLPCASHNRTYTWAQAELNAVCNKYMWAPPMYKCWRYVYSSGLESWTCRLVLPNIVGPIETRACFTPLQAQAEAAALALCYIKLLWPNLALASPVSTPQVYQPLFRCQYTNSLPLYMRAPSASEPASGPAPASAALPHTATFWR